MIIRAPRRSGFTLAEVLVSILIFSIVSLAMITILLTSTNVFRAGEYGRASTDEALAALGTLDEDLKRLVPARAGGFFYSRLYHDPAAVPTPGDNGNCAVAFTIAAPPTTLDINGAKARLIVMYWVETIDRGTPTEDEALMRAVAPVANDLAAPTTLESPTVRAELFPAAGPRPYPPTIVARRCLHFGAWVSSEEKPRALAGDWTLDASGATIAPDTGGADYCTEAVGAVPPIPPDPFPTAIRFTLSMAAGRYAPSGYVIEDDQANNRMRIAGLRSLPTVAGSMVRVEDEWIAYRDFQGGALLWDAGMRGARRSTFKVHTRNDRVFLGQTYSLARTFPH